MLTDPIADMLTRIRNALAVRKESVSIPQSKVKVKLSEILKQEGYIKDARTEDGELVLSLRYYQGKPAIRQIKRLSKPGRRVYQSYKKMYSPQNGLGVYIVSTPKGLMTSTEARKNQVGGEIICEIF